MNMPDCWQNYCKLRGNISQVSRTKEPVLHRSVGTRSAGFRPSPALSSRPQPEPVDYAAPSSPTSCPCFLAVLRAHEGTVKEVWWTAWKRMNCNTCPGGKGARSQPLPKLPGRFKSSSSTRTKPGPAYRPPFLPVLPGRKWKCPF